MSDAPSIGPEFFDIRYAAGRTPWDHGGVPHSLNVFLDTHLGPGRVLIPGCGSAYEIEAFSSSGWDVIGIDFSKVAVARARSLLGPLAGKVREGDFFTYPLREASFDIVYERTFLCALLPDARPQYARRIDTLIAPSGILCGFFFLGPEGEPPPYPIAQDELDELLGDSFEKVEDATVKDSLPLFTGRERWQIWMHKVRDHRDH
ncbi:MAG TPA: methyltransferase domain-containing protein [Chthoniobacterales bacterium]|nr:methyltransferase domain-containing protein [Chthoniobacterales bacterium]